MCDMADHSWLDEHQHRKTPMLVTKTMVMTVTTVTTTILANFHPPFVDIGHVAL